MPTIQVVGFNPASRTPRMYFAVVLGGPGTSAGLAQKTIILYANMITANLTGASPAFTCTAGTATVEQTIQVTDPQQAGGYFGRGSEAALGCASVFSQYKQATLYVIPVAVAGGAAASTATITVTVASNTAVTINLFIAGRLVQVNTAAGDSATTIATAIANAINNAGDLPVTAQNTAGVVTLTAKIAGTRGNLITVRATMVSGSNTVKANGLSPVKTLNGVTLAIGSSTATTIAVASNGQNLPQATINVASTTGFSTSGTAIVVTSAGPQVVTYSGTTGTSLTGAAGGTGAMATGGAVTWVSVQGNAILMAGGTGTDSLTNALAYVANKGYDRHALAQVDATNINKLKAQLDLMAAVATDIWQQGIGPCVDTYANGVVLSTAVNGPRIQIPWHYNADPLPIEISAQMAAARLYGDAVVNGSVIGEAQDPAANLNYVMLATIPQQDADADRPTPSQIENALSNGLVPLAPTQANPGYVCAVASITSRFLDAQSLPNYSVWKTKIVTVSDWVAYDLRSDISTQFAGYKLKPDTSDGSPMKIAKVCTPRDLKGRIINKLKLYEENGVLMNVDAHISEVAVTIDPTNVNRALADIPEVPIADFDGMAANVRALTQ